MGLDIINYFNYDSDIMEVNQTKYKINFSNEDIIHAHVSEIKDYLDESTSEELLNKINKFVVDYLNEDDQS